VAARILVVRDVGHVGLHCPWRNPRWHSGFRVVAVTIIGKSRLNRHRCENCGHPIVRGKPCRLTGVVMDDCVDKAVHYKRLFEWLKGTR
jgi:hypothetical protein